MHQMLGGDVGQVWGILAWGSLQPSRASSVIELNSPQNINNSPNRTIIAH
jgi:hypothetical protein